VKGCQNKFHHFVKKKKKKLHWLCALCVPRSHNSSTGEIEIELPKRRFLTLNKDENPGKMGREGSERSGEWEQGVNSICVSTGRFAGDGVRFVSFVFKRSYKTGNQTDR